MVAQVESLPEDYISQSSTGQGCVRRAMFDSTIRCSRSIRDLAFIGRMPIAMQLKAITEPQMRVCDDCMSLLS